MSKATEAKLDAILRKLNWLIPDVFALPANALDMSAGIHFLPVQEICYITTDHKNDNYRLLYKMQDGLEYFSNHQIQRMEYSSARDLYFAADSNPVINAVSLSYLDEFKRRFEDAHK